MKKILPMLIALLLCFTGCASQKETKSIDINNPYEISVNGEILSYYDTKDDINTKYIYVSDNISETIGSLDKPNTVIVNKDGNIRFISITDESISTYKQISVGDDINKIKNTFNQISQLKDTYSVLFNNDNIEEDPTNQNKEDTWIWITYYTDGSKITSIQIYDVLFGREAR